MLLLRRASGFEQNKKSNIAELGVLWAWGVVRVAAGRRAARRPQARGSAVVHSSRDDGQLRGSGSTAYREHAMLTWDRVDPRFSSLAGALGMFSFVPPDSNIGRGYRICGVTTPPYRGGYCRARQ